MMKVSELIEKLKDLPQDMPVAVSDADTGWWLELTYARVTDGYFLVGGEYGDEVEGSI